MKRILSLRFFAISMFLSLAFAVSAQQTMIFTPLVADEENSSGKVVRSLGDVTLKVRVLPAIKGQAALIKFDLTNSSGKLLATSWYKQGLSTYEYMIKKSSGETDRVLQIISSEMESEFIAMWIPEDYSDVGSFFFNFLDSSRTALRKAYELVFSASDSKKLFQMVARAVKNLNFRKVSSQTLNIDVN